MYKKIPFPSPAQIREAHWGRDFSPPPIPGAIEGTYKNEPPWIAIVPGPTAQDVTQTLGELGQKKKRKLFKKILTGAAIGTTAWFAPGAAAALAPALLRRKPKAPPEIPAEVPTAALAGMGGMLPILLIGGAVALFAFGPRRR